MNQGQGRGGMHLQIGRQYTRAPCLIFIYSICQEFFSDPWHPQIPPNPPLIKGGNYKELLVKSPFEKGGFRGI